jgi:hypothetical protein
VARRKRPKAPAPRLRSQGRFATDAQRKRDAIRQLQRQVREEKQHRKLFKPGTPKVQSGKTGRYLKVTGHESPTDKAFGKLGKRAAVVRSESQLGKLDSGTLPPYDAKKTVPGIAKTNPVFLYYWRYDGLLGEDMARMTLRLLIRRSEFDPDLVARVVIRTGWGKNENAVNSRNGTPQQALRWLDDLLARESVTEILGLDEDGEANGLRFEVIAITRIQMEGREQGIDNGPHRKAKTRFANTSTTAKAKGKPGKRGTGGKRGNARLLGQATRASKTRSKGNGGHRRKPKNLGRKNKSATTRNRRKPSPRGKRR